MNNLLTAMVIVLGINFLLWTSQAAVLEMNPTSRFYNNSQSILENQDVSKGTDEYGDLPTSGGAVNTDTGNIFVDTFGTFINWVADRTGASAFVKILKAPYTMLSMLGFEPGLTAMIGTLWYLVTIALIVLVATGRN